MPTSPALTSRRRFLQHSALLAGAAAFPAPSLHAADANRKIVLGLIGPGGMGMNHLRTLVKSPDVEIAWVCDPDEKRLRAATAAAAQGGGRKPNSAADLRRVLEDKAVDAVFIATPDHWHVPAALLALEAGKHVYVEKPCSHNVREGRWLVDAALRARRVVQIGTQSRSADHVRQAMDRLRSGVIGDILVAKAWNSQRRANIGRAQPAPPPAGLDFDLWVGPAPMTSYQSNLLPGSWRWFTAFGCGDAGNDGVHDLDLARWGLGVDTHPSTMSGLGGKYFFDDDQQFPDTQYVTFEYDLGGKKRQLIYEHRIWSPYVQEGHENGNAFYGTKGMLVLGKQDGWKLFGERNELIEEQRGAPNLAAHHQDFFQAIRNGTPTRADAKTGHLSAALAHFSNIATRLGTTLKFDPAKEQFIGHDGANPLLRRSYREGHWAAPKGAA